MCGDRSGTVILIKKEVKDENDALYNFFALSDEARPRSRPRTASQNRMPPPPFPSLPRCYGWIKIDWREIPKLDPPVRMPVDEVDWHWAIVYEYVPGQVQDNAVGQAHLDFFRAVGFSLGSYKPDNWHGGRLIDMNDIYSPFTRGWNKYTMEYRDAKEFFWTLDFVRTHCFRSRNIVQVRNKLSKGSGNHRRE